MISLEDLSKQTKRSTSGGHMDEEKIWTFLQTPQRLHTGENDREATLRDRPRIVIT